MGKRWEERIGLTRGKMTLRQPQIGSSKNYQSNSSIGLPQKGLGVYGSSVTKGRKETQSKAINFYLFS